jgi:glycosyltransferase involved in cell wall biosynthesis
MNINLKTVNKPEISVIIPTYKSSSNIGILIEKLVQILISIKKPYEIIIVDDGSPDNTWDILKNLINTHKFLKIFRLARNRGQHTALLCGFYKCNGNIIITMDDDLQNPPEEIPKLIEPLYNGYDLSIASYTNKNHPFFKNLCGSIVDFTQKRIFNLPYSFKLTSFRAIKYFIIENILKMDNFYPYITSMILHSTTNYINVPTEHHKRLSGKSNYNFKKNLTLALNLWLNYSSYPLYFVILLCSFSLFFCLIFTIYVIWQALTIETTSGWASLMVVISFFNSLILLSLVIHSIFLSRNNINNKSLFLVSEILESINNSE